MISFYYSILSNTISFHCICILRNSTIKTCTYLSFSTCYPEALVLSTDLNPAACKATKNTASRNNNKGLEVKFTYELLRA